MKKIFSATMAVFLAISFLFISRGFLLAEETTKPVVNTAFYAANYHYFIDTDDSFKIHGSGFGDIQGNVINIDKNLNLVVQSWSDTFIEMAPINNNGTVSIGPNNLIVRTSDEIDSEQFIVTFEKYWIGPNILSINPSVIHLGDQVEITGENFGDSQPTDCPVIPSNPAVPVQVACGVLNGNNQPQKVVSWSNNKIVAIIDNTNISSKIPIRIVAHPFISNDDRTREGKSGYIEVLAQSCTSSDWSCTNWSSCSTSGAQTRTCSKTSNCEGGVSAPITSQNCTLKNNPYICYPNCDARTCVNNSCNQSGYMKATVGDKISLVGFNLNLTKEITVASTPIDTWSVNEDEILEFYLPNNIKEGGVFVNLYGSERELIAHGTLTIYSKSATLLPTQPLCSTDTWQCGSWGTCSPQGIQTRSCTKTFDCPSAETAAPATSQYCVAPNQPKQQSPTEDLGITNQSSIIKATVKLICPVSRTMASQGSGTVINSTGLILTNKHVIDGTAGCLVGFINDYGDEPYFNDRQIADIYKISSDADAAVLKLRNPDNKILSSVNISQSNSSIKLGEILTTYGYPAKFGTKLTYTSGDFSGVDGNYLKTTAIIEHGNSGGGAYLKNGNFIGIPTAVIKGDLNSMGYVLSISKINSWLNNSAIAYNSGSDNNYSRVSSILEDIDLSTLNSLDLYIADNKTETQKVIEEEKSLVTKADEKLSKRVSGNILLQVESKGEGWYVNPDNKKKYYLGKPSDAFSIMRNLGLGIKHSELEKYLNSKFPIRLAGKIMLDVEQKGEAYYVNPKDLKGYFLNKPSDAFQVMRNLGLGITNADIRKIDVGEVK